MTSLQSTSRRAIATIALSILLSPVSICGALAQESGTADQGSLDPVESVVRVEDALHRGTPSSSISGFLDAASEFDFEMAAEYLDLRQLPEEVDFMGGEELARQLNHVISRSIWLDEHSLSDNPEGQKGDGLPANRDHLVIIETSFGEVPLWMQRVPRREDGQLIWKVSNRSVALIPRLYDEYTYPRWVETVRAWFPPHASFLGLELFKWFIIIVLALISWPVLHVACSLLVRLFVSPERSTYTLWRQVLTGPVVALGVLIVASIAFLELGAGALAQKLGSTNTLSTIVFVWGCWVVIDLVKKHQQDKLLGEGRPGAAQLMQPLTTFLKLLILLLASLFWLNNIGVNITAVLAGLGVGGLALALALQKPLEDMMGALTLFTQAPIKVGDLCQYGDIFGTVEEIGLRSTRIRTLTNTLVHVPNARIAHAEIENLSSRTMIRFWPTLRLRYDTTPAQLRDVMARIQAMLEQHEQVHDEPLRVRLTDFADDAFLVKLHAFMKTTDFPESLAIAQDLNFRIIDILHDAGVRFALPGSSIYMEEPD